MAVITGQFTFEAGWRDAEGEYHPPMYTTIVETPGGPIKVRAESHEDLVVALERIRENSDCVS